MNIDLRPLFVPFGSLEPTSTFAFCDSVCYKLSNEVIVASTGEIVNAIDLSDSYMLFFKADEMVIPVSTTVKIK